jgi:butyryl-CoA dehydrogenase
MPTPSVPQPLDPGVLELLAARADHADSDMDWPAESWRLLRDAGVLKWAVPKEFEGVGLDHRSLLVGYEAIAGACLTSAFILSQREAAVRRLCAYPIPELQRRLLPGLAGGQLFASVGLSQLTTSRQHVSPALAATACGSATNPTGYRLDGLIPWVTGADQADFLIVGATRPDGLQVIFVLPTDHAGVTIEPPAPLMSLRG